MNKKDIKRIMDELKELGALVDELNDIEQFNAVLSDVYDDLRSEEINASQLKSVLRWAGVNVKALDISRTDSGSVQVELGAGSYAVNNDRREEEKGELLKAKKICNFFFDIGTSGYEYIFYVFNGNETYDKYRELKDNGKESLLLLLKLNNIL